MHGLRAALDWVWYGLSWLLKSLWGMVRLVKVTILWWWRIYKPHPIAALLLIVIFILPVAVVLREFSPHRHFVVAPFEVPSPTSGHIAVTGRTVANLLADELRIILDKSAGPTSADRLQAEAVPDTLSVGLEVGGLSLETFLALWDRIRHQHVVITGDVIFSPGRFTLQARMLHRGTWEAGVQQTTEEALKAACRQLALNLLHDVEPEVMGRFYQSSGKLDQAIEAYNKALELNPQEPDTLNNLGNTLASQGKFDAAIDNYNQALALKPEHPRARYNLATTLSEKGEEAEAIDAYKKVVDLKVADPETLDRVGVALRARGQHDEAIKAHRQALALKPENPKIRYNLGLALQKAGRNEEAEREFSESIEAYQKTLRRNPKLAKTRYNLALALRKAQREQEARQEFRKAQRLDPNLKPPMD